MILPSARGRTFVEVYYLVDHAPFICGVDGHITSEILSEIESDMTESEYWKRGSGLYLCAVQWIDAQIGDEGRVELPGYWDLDIVQFEPMETFAPSAPDEPPPF